MLTKKLGNMMTPEELQAARDVEGCYEYDHCKARELIDPLLEHIDEQAATIESLQADIDRLKAALIEERAFFFLNNEEDDFSFWHRYPEEDRQIDLWKTTYTEPGKKTLRAMARESLSVDFPDLFKEAGT